MLVITHMILFNVVVFVDIKLCKMSFQANYCRREGIVSVVWAVLLSIKNWQEVLFIPYGVESCKWQTLHC